MSILEQNILLVGSKGTARRRALFDSGASYSIIRRDLAESISGLEPIPDPENYVFETARPGATVRATDSVRLGFASMTLRPDSQTSSSSSTSVRRR